MDYSITTQEIEAQPVIVGRRRVARAEIATAIGDVLPRVFRYAQERGIAIAGQPFVRSLDGGGDVMTLEPGMPVAEGPEPEDVRDRTGEDEALQEAGLTRGTLPGGRVATTVHTGSYESLHRAYASLEAWIGAEGLTAAAPPWESYLTDPTAVPDPADWKTRIYWPVSG